VLGRAQFWTFLNLGVSGAAGFALFYLIAVLIGLDEVRTYTKRFLRI
jgi:hypothetical protein